MHERSAGLQEPPRGSLWTRQTVRVHTLLGPHHRSDGYTPSQQLSANAT